MEKFIWFWWFSEAVAQVFSDDIFNRNKTKFYFLMRKLNLKFVWDYRCHRRLRFTNCKRKIKIALFLDLSFRISIRLFVVNFAIASVQKNINKLRQPLCNRRINRKSEVAFCIDEAEAKRCSSSIIRMLRTMVNCRLWWRRIRHSSSSASLLQFSDDQAFCESQIISCKTEQQKKSSKKMSACAQNKQDLALHCIIFLCFWPFFSLLFLFVVD